MTSTAHEPASQVGGYRLMTRLGEGGMGIVHLAQAPDGRRVALKVLRPHVVGDQEARDRLAREVSSLRRVHSFRVAEIVDADSQGPTPYVATRYVPGLPLHEHVREEGPLSGPDLLHFAVGLAEGLRAVHDVGVVHRDIKPSNVLMEGRNPVLIDFGLARVADDVRLTRTGWLLGTPGYLSPEILYGDPATTASDVHAWAATVAFAATGRAPYGTGPAMAVLDRIRNGEHDLTGVPEPVRSLVERALDPEPHRRPSLAELLSWLAERTGVARASRQESRWTEPVRSVPAPVNGGEAPTYVGTDSRVVPARSTPQPAGVYVPARRPAEEPPPLPAPVTASRGSGLLVRAQVVALLAVVAGVVAYAPYAGVLVLLGVVWVLRTTSVVRERMNVRRVVRGGRRAWHDLPRAAIGLPLHAFVAAFGSVLLVACGVTAALVFGLVEALFGPSLPVGLLLAGAVLATCLWWGPGGGRVRETVHAGVARAAEREYAGVFVVVASLVLAAALVGAVVASGPVWAPASSAPWSGGVLGWVAGLV
ncbi:serine/threonine-protein kinase [Marmoricola endophyticus]|uniref:serine/threonine-protein kinase n=1 Tax=Marmoricola endophyticus TaxID=2040280 RepID=UPI00166F2D00|nr:serine/threonine-protein kinase [Marmoricola endophyticus]